MKVQVEKKHYSLQNYVDAERWYSYYNQLREIIAAMQDIESGGGIHNWKRRRYSRSDIKSNI